MYHAYRLSKSTSALILDIYHPTFFMHDVMIVNAVFTSSMSTFLTYVTRHNSIYILVFEKKNVIYIDISVYFHIFKTKNTILFFF